MSNPLKKRTTPSVRFIECYDEQDEEDSLRLREELNDGPSIEEMERAYLQAEKEEQEVEQEAEKAYQRQLRERREQERNDAWNARAEAERTIRDELERKYQADLEQEWAASVEYERMYRTSMEQKWAAREAQVAEKERLLQEEVDRLKREGEERCIAKRKEEMKRARELNVEAKIIARENAKDAGSEGHTASLRPSDQDVAEIYAKAISASLMESNRQLFENLYASNKENNDNLCAVIREMQASAQGVKNSHSNRLQTKDITLCLHQPGDGPHMYGLHRLPNNHPHTEAVADLDAFSKFNGINVIVEV